jgi:hypothetical protein
LKIAAGGPADEIAAQLPWRCHRLVWARSTSSSPRPLNTALSM